MIRIADVGVGIEGKEGSDAVMSSDFSISEFRHLAQLLIVQGRWCALRVSLLCIFTYYKTTMIALMQGLFGILNGFSASTAFDAGFLAVFNLLLAIPQLFYICVFEEDVSAEVALAVPEMYRDLQKTGGVGIVPWLWMYVHAIVHGGVTFCFSYWEASAVCLDYRGTTYDHAIFTQVGAWCLLFVFTMSLAMKFRSISVLHIVLYAGCVLISAAIEYFYAFFDKHYFRIMKIVLRVPRMW
jgi:magnesium-transporting ATPase (P-type)